MIVDKLINLIKLKGGISVSEYITMCLVGCPESYYNCSPIFGPRGDFTTSPEISPLFGETIGFWILSKWLLDPRPFSLAELGPGKGTLLRDAFNIFQQVPAFMANFKELHFVELGQQFTSLSFAVKPTFHASVYSLPKVDFVISNEFLDVLPVNLFEASTGPTPTELLVDYQRDAFQLVKSRRPTANSVIVSKLEGLKYLPGVRFEVSFDAICAVNQIKKQARHAVFIDYAKKSKDISLRAIKNHKFVDLFYRPGECDITADVDFQYLQKVTNAKIYDQSEFLYMNGIKQRLASLLLKNTNNAALLNGYSRITKEMGSIFKVLEL